MYGHKTDNLWGSVDCAYQRDLESTPHYTLGHFDLFFAEFSNLYS